MVYSRGTHFFQVKNLSSNRAFSLVELMISLIIMSIFAAMFYNAFFASKNILTSARELSMATSLAGSMLSSLKTVSEDFLTTMHNVSDENLPSGLTLTDLRISPVPENYNRELTLIRHIIPGSQKAVYIAEVEVKWEPRTRSGQVVTHKLRSIVAGRKL